MRCKECNIDLPDSYTVCPLCHNEAANEPAVIDIPEAEYPAVYKEYVIPRKSDLPVKYIVRAGILLSLVLGIISIFTTEKIWCMAVPAISAILAISCFISAFIEKSTLLHSIIALLSVIAFQAVFLMISVILKVTITYMIITFVFGIILFALLYILKPKRASDQLKATFSIH